MTGIEFEAAIKAAGYNQRSFAQLMGVHRTRIGERYAKDIVEPYWVYALAGLIAVQAARSLLALVGPSDPLPLEMTGDQFQAALQAAGYNQGTFAHAMGVHRNTIGTQYAKNEVELHWVYALAGIVATRAAEQVVSVIRTGLDYPK